jgi:cell division protein FtsB
VKTLSKSAHGRKAQGVAPMLPTHAVAQPALPSNRHAHPNLAGKRVRRTIPLVSLGLPLIVGMLVVMFHLGGLALLNFASARHAWHEKELRRLQQQNEQLRAQLNTLTSEPEVRRWAEAQGMVRAESQTALLIPRTDKQAEQARRVVNPPTPFTLSPLSKGGEGWGEGGFNTGRKSEIPQSQVNSQRANRDGRE